MLLKNCVCGHLHIDFRVYLTHSSQEDPREAVKRIDDFCFPEPPEPKIQLAAESEAPDISVYLILRNKLPNRNQCPRGKPLRVLATGGPEELRCLAEMELRR